MNFPYTMLYLAHNRVLIFSEHQSTINENMPLRDLMYVGRTYEKLVPVKERYKRKAYKIPSPEFFAFYNGTEKIESEKIIKLSDAYNCKKNGNDVSLELKVKVIDINTDSGNEILKKCHILRE